jgi:hypothetical protein
VRRAEEADAVVVLAAIDRVLAVGERDAVVALVALHQPVTARRARRVVAGAQVGRAVPDEPGVRVRTRSLIQVERLAADPADEQRRLVGEDQLVDPAARQLREPVAITRVGADGHGEGLVVVEQHRRLGRDALVTKMMSVSEMTALRSPSSTQT